LAINAPYFCGQDTNLYEPLLKQQVLKVEKIDTFGGHRDCVYTLCSDALPHRFYSAGGDGQVVRWDLTKPDLGELIAQVEASVYAIGLDTQRGRLWVGQNFEGLHVIDVATKQRLSSLKLAATQIFDIQFTQSLALVALGDGTVVVLDTEAFAIKKHLRASPQSARCIAVNQQADEFAVGYSDAQIRVFGLQDLSLRYVINAHSNSVFALRYTPDGRFLVSGSRDAHLKQWSVWDNYQLTHDVAAHLFAINHLAFSPDARLLVTGSMDKSLKIWDVEQLKLLKVIDRARHAGHGTSVNKVLWTTHHNVLASASDDRTISVWKLHES
jgi:WD40 repeat protein